MASTSDTKSGKIPRKAQPSEQVKFEINPGDVDTSLNTHPEALDIDVGELFIQATEQTRMALCVSDPHQPDTPIVYVNQAFATLTGYDRSEIVGQNCRFLQGPDTSRDAIRRIKDGLVSNEVRVVDILNYRKDGTAFWNALHIGPIFDENGDVRYFYGSQWDVTEIFSNREKALEQTRVAEELQHRSKNLFAILSAIVRLSTKGVEDAQSLAERISGRIEALGAAHKVSLRIGVEDHGKTDVRELIAEIMTPYQIGEESRINLVGEDTNVPEYAITPVGLAIHELATNAVKYGSLGVEDGSVCIDWVRDGDRLTIEWVEKDGPKIDMDARRSDGTGSRLSERMLRAIGGVFDRTFHSDGLKAKLVFPLERLAPNAPEKS